MDASLKKFLGFEFYVVFCKQNYTVYRSPEIHFFHSMCVSEVSLYKDTLYVFIAVHPSMA